jgi:predicted RNA-binding Zn-ribbon protein involved in translation (DUF1610 family)
VVTSVHHRQAGIHFRIHFIFIRQRKLRSNLIAFGRRILFMEAKRTQAVKPSRSFDEAYGFSFAIALGLLLFIGGLVISLTVGRESSYGLLFGVPMILAGLVIPLFMMRGSFVRSDIVAPCPACGHEIKTTDSTMQLDCPNCGKVIAVRGMSLFVREE